MKSRATRRSEAAFVIVQRSPDLVIRSRRADDPMTRPSSHPTRRADGRLPTSLSATTAIAAAMNVPVEALDLLAQVPHPQERDLVKGQ